MASLRTPLSTYRVQLQPEFGFAAAAEVVDYLAELGVSHLYASPLLQAAPGSTHGYDVVDHTRPSDDLGGEDGRQALVAALRSRGLGQVLDIVPNHMSVADPRRNAWWWDVLTHGSASSYAGWFDIDWDAAYTREPEARGKLLLPVLGDGPGELDALRLVEEDGALLLAYHDRRFPVAPGTAQPGDEPAAVHARQHYRLASWRRGGDSLNYRRFFDISDLAAVRVEDSRVFAETHREVLDWVYAGEVDGLRIDHPDGLADPVGYLRRLATVAPGAWIVVEKILEPGERLPADWPVAGTTGYDALRELTGLLVDASGLDALTDAYTSFTHEPGDFATIAHAQKLTAALTSLRAETARLAALLERAGVVEDWAAAVDPLAELLASFPVYRTYLRPGWPSDPAQAGVLREAVTTATRRRADDGPLLAAVEQLVLAPRSGLDVEFAARLQQTTGMVMAKGVEDTAFYRYHRLVALNEVGGDPEHVVSPGAFHAACLERQAAWPTAMTALSTHDTKRSEDVRARLAVLSELPEEWAAAVTRWNRAAASHRSPAGPDGNAEYLFWQTLVGAWPIDGRRLGGYLEKATREAKQHTSWVDPDPAYDEAVRAFVSGVLADAALMADVETFVARVVVPGRLNALAQKLLQLTMPGVPDVYQGSECWDLSLVDPDNRRPVDFGLRRALLLALDDADAGLPSVHDDSGAAKLLVVSRALRLRRSLHEAFRGDYEAVAVEGSAAEHVVAFARGGAALTVVPRLTVTLERSGGWRDTALALPDGPWRDVLTGAEREGGRTLVADLLADFPVALLTRS